MYDVIVVGARCAGSPLAMLLARRGHKVLVVDRATFPSDTVSTHYIHQAGLARLRDWGILDRLVATGVPAMRHMVFTYTDITLTGFADPIEGITEAYSPRRTVLDTILVDEARSAGAEVVEGFTVTGVVFDDGRAAGVRGRVGDGPEQEFRARFVVGADGRNSTVAGLVGAEIYRSVPAACFVYYSYYSGLDWTFHHRTGFDLQQFGAWPTHDGQHLIAVMRRKDRMREFRADVEGNFHEIYDQIDPRLGEELRTKGKREENFRAMAYPDNFYRRSAGPGWALVGDAGYHKDPFTGWGISDALKYTEVLAEKLDEGLAGQRPIDEAVLEYTKIRDAESNGTFELTCSVSELSLTPYYDSVFRATSWSPEYTKKFFGLIGGGIHGEEFFAPAALEQLYEEVDYPVDRRFTTQS
ncbi:putative hydroxylase [Frankia sp. AiPs1]|uniref:NAD(P)/FAD-dependent oxidoreductase n=1 Tax=Frankia sp. AiPa1 TaxID=573492 RepID=UPI00202AEE22|nr:NAD(P)/FAD-dependent oxidoreductase [Frankia sp. AiPa1]MCL9760240.1 NAD(P)/FAD-dependent oxidoreductase [Frankia sp. AiPa1]